MAIPIRLDIDAGAIDADGICVSQTPAAGGAQELTITGALVVSGTGVFVAGEAAGIPGPYGVQVAVDTTGDESARTFTITGTDPDGRPISEDITSITSGAAKEGLLYYQTVTSVAVDADTAGAITVGTVDELRSSTVILDWYSPRSARSVVDVTGTVSFSISSTSQDVKQEYDVFSNTQAGLVVVEEESAGAVDVSTSITNGATGVYLTFASYSAGAEVQWTITQGMRG
ncbi:MAG: hypothetical protein ACYS8I_14040 [Planctomycetota bacterium]|jgi:hypothetical protein